MTIHLPEFTLRLNQYRIAGSFNGLWISGPDPKCCTQIEEKFTELMDTGAGRIIMSEVFDKENKNRRKAARARLKAFLGVPPDPRREARKAIERKKLKKKKARNRPPSRRQIEYARKTGMDVPDKISRSDICRLLIEFGLIRSYIRKTWGKIAGKNPRETGIGMDELNETLTGIMQNEEMAAEIFKLQHTELDLACIWPSRARRLFARHKYGVLTIPSFSLAKVKKQTEKKVSAFLRKTWKKHR